MFKDTYFLDANEARRVASLQNKPNTNTLQLCYYSGKKIESDLVNLVHLPFENFVDSLAQGSYRLPSKIDMTGLDLSVEIELEITRNFYILLEDAKAMREEYNKEYINALRKRRLNFNEPLRFYLASHNNTQVMKFVSKALADTLSDMGYEVVFDLKYGIEDNLCLKNLLLANPHATININHMNSHLIGEDVFNFVWFQDPMPFLQDSTKVTIRKRDFIFSLLPLFDKMLEKKAIPFERQGFCINKKVYKHSPKIQREKKIVFIGSSYLKTIPNKEGTKAAVRELEEMFLHGDTFTDEMAGTIASKYKLNEDFVNSRLIPYVVRDIGLLELCKIDTEYKIEIYGWGWEVYEELKPFYKGVLSYGEEIADVYNSATFAFAPHQQYTLQQRTFEASACGALPIVYDCRNLSGEDSYEEALCYYKTTEDLEKIVNTDIPKKDFSRLLQNHTYEFFIQRMIKMIEVNKEQDI